MKKLLLVVFVFVMFIMAIPAFAQVDENLIPCVNMTPSAFAELVAIKYSDDVTVDLPAGNCEIGLVVYNYADFTVSVPFWNRTSDLLLIGIPIFQEWGQALTVLDWAQWPNRGFLLLEDSWGWIYEININYSGSTDLNIYLPDNAGRIYDHDGASS